MLEGENMKRFEASWFIRLSLAEKSPTRRAQVGPSAPRAWSAGVGLEKWTWERRGALVAVDWSVGISCEPLRVAGRI